jgi:hypothetical protein
MKKNSLIISMFITFLLFYSCIATIHSPTIVKKHDYGSFDISFKWKFQNNTLTLTCLNNYWIEIFDLEFTVTPVNDNLEPIGKNHKKYIGSFEMDETFTLKYKFNTQNMKYIKVDYKYTYAGYNSSGSRLNYYTIYLKVK